MTALVYHILPSIQSISPHGETMWRKKTICGMIMLDQQEKILSLSE